MYQKGEGVEKDDTRSFKWYLKAAELGNRDAFYIVASYYYSTAKR